MRRRALVVAAALSLSVVAPPAASSAGTLSEVSAVARSAAHAASAPSAKVKVLTDDQRTVQRARKLRVRVRLGAAGSVALAARLYVTSKATRLVEPRRVAFAKAGTKTVDLKLTKGGAGALAKAHGACEKTAVKLSAIARPGHRGGAAKGRTQSIALSLKRDADVCAGPKRGPGGASRPGGDTGGQGIGSSGSGSGSGGGGGGNEGGGSTIRAGAASVDASWHVGSSAGQYATDCIEDPSNVTRPDCPYPGDGEFDPAHLTTRRAASYGMQSRLSARALVFQEAGGPKIAMVKNDLYISQDLLNRRVAQILEAGNSGVDRQHLTIMVAHDHSSPYYSSTSWGVWAFQDVFDVRFYEYYAERMAEAVEKAAANMKPVRVGAAVGYFDKTHKHSFGPAIADDGTPAGYPEDETDHDLTVIRFDDISDKSHPKPLANLVNWSGHPEMLSGNDLISADYVGPLQRMLDRETHAVTIFSQGVVGTAEPERSRYHSIHERLEFNHREYAQAEYAARLLADKAEQTRDQIASGHPEDPGRFVAFSTAFPVKMEDRWFPGPVSHPYPGVSSCRTDPTFHGYPRLPLVGLPDCQDGNAVLSTLADIFGIDPPPQYQMPIDPGISTDDLESRGIPVPENYSAPSYTGLQEDVDIHLQTIKLGDILLTVCSCEQWNDQTKNIDTRTDRTPGNEWVGYDWSARCSDNGDGTWRCPNPSNPSQSLPPVSDQHLKRMRAQVRNAADGWDDPSYTSQAESEPTDPTQIKGNYTHDDTAVNVESQKLASYGYKLTVPISHALDYNGYIATYREYQRGDHYRKALTGWGPHSSDYLATRLVRMGRHMNGGTDLAEEPLAQKVPGDMAANDQRATALGQMGTAGIAAYEASLPDDGGAAAAVDQPADIQRFDAAFFRWVGGSNFTDDPVVKVQRRQGPDWVDEADQSGELPVTLEFPHDDQTQSYLQGDQQWKWTAHFEAFVGRFDTGRGHVATPAGEYRFVVDGKRREGGQVKPYHLESNTFRVESWRGVAVDDIRRESDGAVSFTVGPRRTVTEKDMDGGPDASVDLGPIDFPDSYSSPLRARFINTTRSFKRDPAAPSDTTRFENYCFSCSFRPWVDTGNAKTAKVTIVHADGTHDTVDAHESGGRWVTDYRLQPGESAFVAAGDVRDAYGDSNGQQSPLVGS